MQYKLIVGDSHHLRETFESLIEMYRLDCDIEILPSEKVFLFYHNENLIGDFENAVDYIEGTSGGYGDVIAIGH